MSSESKKYTIRREFLDLMYKASTESQKKLIEENINGFTGETTEVFLKEHLYKVACNDWKKKMEEEFSFLKFPPLTYDEIQYQYQVLVSDHIDSVRRATTSMQYYPTKKIAEIFCNLHKVVWLRHKYLEDNGYKDFKSYETDMPIPAITTIVENPNPFTSSSKIIINSTINNKYKLLSFPTMRLAANFLVKYRVLIDELKGYI